MRGDVCGVGARAMRVTVMVSKRVQMVVMVVRMTWTSQQPQNLPVYLGRSLGPTLSNSRRKSCARAWTSIFSRLDVHHLIRYS